MKLREEGEMLCSAVHSSSNRECEWSGGVSLFSAAWGLRDVQIILNLLVRRWADCLS